MISKAEIVRTIHGVTVLDIGASGYGGFNAYECELREAWAGCDRTTVDLMGADINCDLNGVIPPLPETYIATCFDVLEHLDNPARVLRSIPCKRLIVCVPNAISPLARWMERRNFYDHVCSYTPYTLRRVLERTGWSVDRIEWQLGTWGHICRALHVIGVFCPSLVATGIVAWAHRVDA